MRPTRQTPTLLAVQVAARVPDPLRVAVGPISME